MRVKAVVVVCLVAMFLAGCGGGELPAAAALDPAAAPTSLPTPKSAVAHTTFESCDEFRDYYARALTREYLEGPWLGVPCWGCPSIGLAAAGAPSPVAGSFLAVAPVSSGPTYTSLAGMANFTPTNTQETGVDELDLVEADPQTGRIYVLRGFPAELVAVKAVPAEELAVSSRQVLVREPMNTPALGMYLDSSARRLVVVQNLTPLVYWDAPLGAFGPLATQLSFFDVTDPDQPRLVQRFQVSGYPIGSRRVGRRIHLVTSFPAGLPRALGANGAFGQLISAYYDAYTKKDEKAVQVIGQVIRQQIVAAVHAAPLADLLPASRRGLDEVTVAQPVACEAVSHSQVDERLGMIAIASINTDGSDADVVAAINNSWRIYASEEHLYLTQHSGGWWWDAGQTQQTAIHRYRLDDDGPAQPAGEGLVDGWLRDRYGMSEHDGYLRTALTEGHWAPAEGWQQTNHLFVLDDQLEVVGAVRDFMRNEHIVAARFLGERGFVSPFRAVDPLFTFDLSDPAAPQLVGQLEVPGVSDYFQTLGEDGLIGVGLVTTPEGGPTGQLQLQLYDVGDLASPQLADMAVFGSPGYYSWSAARTDGSAFMLANDLLSFPVNFNWADPLGRFGGFVVYRVGALTFSELGRIEHPALDESRWWGNPNNPALRSILLTEESGRDVLYTLSSDYLKAHAVSHSVTPIQSVTLEPSEYRITVGIQEMAYISRHSLHLSFVDVTEDSRCAIGVQCPWEGRATIRLVVGGGPSGTNPNEWRELTIPGAATTDYFGYTITLLELRPYPGESTPAAYEATLLVTPPE